MPRARTSRPMGNPETDINNASIKRLVLVAGGERVSSAALKLIRYQIVALMEGLLQKANTMREHERQKTLKYAHLKHVLGDNIYGEIKPDQYKVCKSKCDVIKNVRRGQPDPDCLYISPTKFQRMAKRILYELDGDIRIQGYI
jgi:histone H3/H4